MPHEDVVPIMDQLPMGVAEPDNFSDLL